MANTNDIKNVYSLISSKHNFAICSWYKGLKRLYVFMGFFFKSMMKFILNDDIVIIYITSKSLTLCDKNWNDLSQPPLFNVSKSF